MYTCPIELSDVRYNAASQSFEAAVTVHDADAVRTYACQWAAPLDTEFDAAARGLSRQAIQTHVRGGGLFSELNSRPPRNRSASKAQPVKAWLSTLIGTPLRELA